MKNGEIYLKFRNSFPDNFRSRLNIQSVFNNIWICQQNNYDDEHHYSRMILIGRRD